MDGFCVNSLGEIVEISGKKDASPQPSSQSPQPETAESEAALLTSLRVRKWSYEDIRDILKRRYLLQQVTRCEREPRSAN
jgi:hypothetical protein